MKKTILTLLISLIIISLSMVAGCIYPIEPDDDGDGGNNDYYNTVTVTNGTDMELAVFFNEVKHENYLARIDVFADKQEIGLPDINKFYVLRFIRYEDYINAESDWDLEDVKVIYSKLVYSDLNELYNVTVQGGLLSGDSIIYWENPTDYWVEVRIEGIDGQVLDVMPPHSMRKDFIPARPYDLFPIFKIELYADAGQTDIIGLKDFADLDQVYTFQAISGEIHTYAVTESNIPSQHVNGYVLLDNQSDNGFRFRNGNTLIISDLGYEVTNSGKQVLYSLEADPAPGREYTNLNVKTTNTSIGNNGEVVIPDMFVITGMMYHIIIKSDYTIQVNAGVPVDDVADISVSYNSGNISDGSTLDYGDVELGNTVGMLFNITNNGSDILELTGTNIIQLSGSSNFSVSQYPSDTSLEEGESVSFEISFNATVEGQATTTVLIENNDMDENPFQFDITVNVILPLPEIEVTDSSGNLIVDGGSFDIGDTNVNTPISETFTITNTSQANLTLIEPKVVIETLDSSYFTVTAYPMILIPAGISSNFTVQFNADDQIADRISSIRIICDGIDDYDFLVTASVIQ